MQHAVLSRFGYLFLGCMLALLNLAGCPRLQNTTVPHVVGLQREAAEAQIRQAHLLVGSISHSYHDTVPVGAVLNQVPSGGVRVSQGIAVSLVLSRGPAPVAVPDVVDKPLAEAISILRQVGLAAGAITEVYHPSAPVGAVIHQSLPRGTSVQPGTPVNLTISRGPEPVPVPDVAGLDLALAAARLNAAGLAPGAVTEEHHPAVAAGAVIRHAPAAGALVLPGTQVALVVSLGPEPVDAIALSNEMYDFELNTLPYNLSVWNTSPQIPELHIAISTDQAWLQTQVSEVTSQAPGPAGELDQQLVSVSVNRTMLSVGTHEGTVHFTAPGVIPKAFRVRVRQDHAQGGQALSIVNPVHTYSVPYLMDLFFSLRDAQGDAVIVDPSEMRLEAREGDTMVDPVLNGLQVRHAAARQLKVHLVLDYSLGMQRAEGAIAAMEDAATTLFLPALSEDAQAGVWEFHRDDAAPAQVVPFTTDRALMGAGIAAIQEEYVHGFSSGSRMWDALLAAAEDFGAGNPNQEARYLVLFSDGNDTSSLATANAVVNACRVRGIRIYAAAFGGNVNVTALQDITSRTGGLYFPAQQVAQVGEAFARIIADLDSQYNVRWASLKRGSTPFFPTFSLGVDGASVTHTTSQAFVPTDHAGDPLRGVLRLEASESADSTIVFLRADYVPRFVRDLRLYLRSPHAFTVELVDLPGNSLLAGWTMLVEEDPEAALSTVHLASPIGEPLPFAGFGPLLRFEFPVLETSPEMLFEIFAVDNTVYAHEQYFVVQDFPEP